MSRAQTLLVGAVVFACAVVGTLIFGVVRQQRLDVYFDNGLATAVSVSVDGDSFPLPSGRPLKRQMTPGEHEVVVSIEAVELERQTVHVEKPELLTAIMGPEFYVYNVAGAHIYRRAEHVYAENPNLRDYKETLFPFQHFFSQPKANFIFRAAPDTITTDSSTARREEFVVATDIDYNTLATMKFNEGNLVDAGRAVDKALELEPCHANAFRNQAALLMFDDEHNGAVELSRSWIAACEATGVEAHRAYQDTMMELGQSVVSEYRSRRSTAPSAETDYLYARLLSGPEAIAGHRGALEKDPLFTRARLALGYELMGVERYADALGELEQCLEDGAMVPETAYVYALAAVGAGKSAEADTKLWPLVAQHPYDMSLWEGRFAAALAREDWDAAERLLAEYQQKMEEEPTSHRVRLLRFRGNAAEAEQIIDRMAVRADLEGEAMTLRFQSLFSEGRYAEAAAALGDPDTTSTLYRLYAAAGLSMGGQRAQIAAWLNGIETELGNGGSDAAFYHEALRHLQGRSPAEAVLEAARDAGFQALPHAYFLVGARARASGNAGARYFARSADTAVYRDFPYLAAMKLR